MKLKDIFQLVSYLQYPLLLVSGYFMVMLYVDIFSYGFESIDIYDYANYVNNFLFYAGIAISFSTLQDTKKTQNNFSKKIWQSPRKSRIFLIIALSFSMFLMLIGVLLNLLEVHPAFTELSTGIIVFGLGFLSIVRAGLEMAEYQQSLLQEKNI